MRLTGFEISHVKDSVRAVFAGLSVCVLSLMAVPSVAAQELEPGAYWPIPAGMNIATVVNSFNWGDIAFDPALPIEDGNAKINTTAFSFTRAFSLAGRSANVGVVVPIVTGHLEGIYLGAPAEADRFGLGDPRVRVAMNLYGAPAMTPKAFASYDQKTLAGVSVTIVPPFGEYDSSKLINIGTNRWSFKPEFGWSRTSGHWIVEAMAGVWLFTDNDDFYGGQTREQNPVTAFQFHLTYRFQRTTWLAGDVNYFTGGRTTINGRQNVDLQKNSRIGATFSRAFRPGQAIRMSVSRGAYTTIGADFTSIAIGYNYAWAR